MPASKHTENDMLTIQSKGGKARAAHLSPDQRQAIASAAAKARWAKPRPIRAKPVKVAPQANSIRKDAFLEDLTTWFQSHTSAYSSSTPLTPKDVYWQAISLAEKHAWLLK